MTKDGIFLKKGDQLSPGELYGEMQCNYPKFFKMDKLCKWAWIAVEYLFSGNDRLYREIDKNKIALALTTAHGCLDVDKRYLESVSLPSPSLFVYTLPNIMLGEICIRHGFKGEQLCMMQDRFDATEIHFITEDFLKRKGMDACLCGWIDTYGDDFNVCLFWITKESNGIALTAAALQELYNQ